MTLRLLPWSPVQDVPPLGLGVGGPEGDGVLPSLPELLNVDKKARGEDEGHVAERRAGTVKTHRDQGAGVILELVTDLETR